MKPTLAFFLTALMAVTAAPSGLEVARDRQDRAALEKAIAEYSAAAARTPNDANAQARLALAASYLAEVSQELHDKKQAQQAAEVGIKAADKAVSLRPDAENYRLLGMLCGQAVTDLMSGLTYGPRAKSAIDKAVELAPRSAGTYLAHGVGNFYVPVQLGHRGFPQGHRARTLERRSLSLARRRPAQGQPECRRAPGPR
jgi:tetratricopeptide (TPR) repeat protein